MPINPQFLAARAAERRQRDVAHLRLPCWLTLRRAGRPHARAPLVPFTLRHWLELQLAGNALLAARMVPVLRGDVFLFLWRLHPLYRPVRLGRESLVAGLINRRFRFLRVWLALGSFRAAFVHRRLTRLVRQCDLAAAVRTLREFLDLTHQDSPGEDFEEGKKSKRSSMIAPERQGTDSQVDWLMSAYSLTHDQALDMPIAIVNQLYRDRQLCEPEGELKVFAPSDVLLGESA